MPTPSVAPRLTKALPSTRHRGSQPTSSTYLHVIAIAEPRSLPASSSLALDAQQQQQQLSVDDVQPSSTNAPTCASDRGLSLVRGGDACWRVMMMTTTTTTSGAGGDDGSIDAEDVELVMRVDAYEVTRGKDDVEQVLVRLMIEVSLGGAGIAYADALSPQTDY